MLQPPQFCGSLVVSVQAVPQMVPLHMAQTSFRQA